MLQLHDDRYDDEPVPALSSLIRIGEVTAVDHAKLTARVTFDDADGLTSYELPILQRNTLRNRDYCTMDVGEDALCVFLPTGVSRGFILGSVYAGEVSPPQSSGDVREIEFEDGTVVSYDRASHRLVADVKGSVEGRAGTSVTITAPVIRLNCSISTHSASGDSGTMKVTGTMEITGNLTGQSDVTASGVSLKGHVHPCENGNTGAPA